MHELDVRITVTPSLGTATQRIEPSATRMDDSRGVCRAMCWLFGTGLAAFGLYGCGGVVIDHDGGTGGARSSGGRATSSGGRATSSGGRATSSGTSGGTTGKPSAGGRTATGGAVGTAGVGGNGGGSVSCASLTQCPDGCVDLATSSTHCGSCFTSCPSNASCIEGICQLSCTPPTTSCPNFSECIDTSSNPLACGACNTPCNGTRCIDGRCDTTSCASPTATYCPAQKACLELSGDPSNCGACGNACSATESCADGKCWPCGEGLTYCPGGCTDTSYDVYNCGGCDRPCLSGSHFLQTPYKCNAGICGCSDGAKECGAACTSVFWYCPPNGVMGSPVDLCLQGARTVYATCACKNCLAEVQACFGSPNCINAMDCALCPGCKPPFHPCTDEKGNPDPIATKLLACMNSTCGSP